MGQFTDLPVSTKAEACLELLNSTAPGKPVFKHFTLLRFVQHIANGTQSSNGPSREWDAAVQQMQASASATSMQGDAAARAGANAIPTAVPAPEPDLSGVSWLADVSPQLDVSVSSAVKKKWEAVKSACGWPSGQGVLEHMYTPYVEGIETCRQCVPNF